MDIYGSNFIFYYLLLTVMWCFFGWTIGKDKGRGAQGFALGALIGIFGVIIIALLPPTKERQK